MSCDRLSTAGLCPAMYLSISSTSDCGSLAGTIFVRSVAIMPPYPLRELFRGVECRSLAGASPLLPSHRESVVIACLYEQALSLVVCRKFFPRELSACWVPFDTCHGVLLWLVCVLDFQVAHYRVPSGRPVQCYAGVVYHCAEFLLTDRRQPNVEFCVPGHFVNLIRPVVVPIHQFLFEVGTGFDNLYSCDCFHCRLRLVRCIIDYVYNVIHGGPQCKSGGVVCYCIT